MEFVMQKVRVCTLFSGSSANSVFIEVGGRGILIDAGANITRCRESLESVGSSFEKITAVFVKQEQSDQIKGRSCIYPRDKIPVLANKPTLYGIKSSLYDIDTSFFREMPTGSKASGGEFEVQSFATSHDSAESVGYIITTPSGKIGVMTDTGVCPPGGKELLGSCRVVILESNHDETMLLSGKYPYFLKKRVGGPRGHLSNLQAGEVLSSLVSSGTQRVFLAHLSKENNTPRLAMESAEKVLCDLGAQPGKDIQVSVSPRDIPSEVYTF